MSDNRTVEQDSCEKLVIDVCEWIENDVREWIDIATYKAFTPEQMFEVMSHRLDRQAAIMRREVLTQPDERDNAEPGNERTCKITATSTNNLMYPDYITKWYELSCGHSLTIKGDEAPKWCAVCGARVKGVTHER